MSSTKPEEKRDCYYATDPRTNPGLATALAGQNVLVTGAGRGVGRVIAVFLTHASAKSLTVVALEQQISLNTVNGDEIWGWLRHLREDELDETIKLCKEVNPHLQTKAVALNVTDAKAVEKLVREVDGEFGGVDVLVCNAGRPPQFLPIFESDPGIWWDTVSISLQHAFLFTRFVLPGMRRRKRGCIVYTASNGAHTNLGIMGSYTLGKLGLVRLAEIVHRENFEDSNIRCFAYHPGRIKTRFFTDFEEKVKGTPQQQKCTNSYVEEDVPLQDKSAQTAYDILHKFEWDTPELAAGLVTALAVGKLDFLSGRFIDANVDIEEYIKNRQEIVKQDLHRVRLHAGLDQFIPRLDY